MNKTKFFSSLLVAVLFATTSVFVSCKDYDDDIKNLQSQIDKAALKADLDALSTKLAGVESTANAAKTTAENALAKANANATEIAAVKATAEKAAKDAAAALTAVATAQSTAEAAQAAAAAAQKTADDAAAAAAAAQKTADEAKALGEAAATKVELAAAKKELDDAIDKLQKAVENLDAVKATKAELADAKTELKAYTDAAKEAALAAAKLAADAAAAAQSTADAATAAAGTAQSTADGAVAAAGKNAEDIAGIKNTIETLATNAALSTLSTELKGEIEGLKTTLAGITGVEEMAELVEIIGNFDTVVETLFSAITSIELVESYSKSSGQGQTLGYDGDPIGLYFYHGVIAEDSKFGDNEAYTAADQQIEYKKGADIKDEVSFLVRVNPVNADLAAANIKLLNSKGEDLEGIVELAGIERFNGLITTRGVTNTGLWKVTYKPATGITEEAFNKAVWTFNKNTQEQEYPILFAIAANNTAEASADRYAVSSYDIALNYGEYQPATSFEFTVNDTYINNIRNRWTNDLNIQAEQQFDTYTNNPELAWNPDVKNIPATVPDVYDAENEKCNVAVDHNIWSHETRRYDGTHFIYADVNEEFVINDVWGNNDDDYEGQQIDYYYVVFDKGNAVESAPSEWNAWNSYTVEGLGVMTKATESLTMKITSASAHGDVVGFRVYAVNRDGTLADPDGRAFYVFVGQPGEENKAAFANIIATKAQPDSEEMDVTGWFKANTWYVFSPRNENNENKNPMWYLDEDDTEDFGMNHAILKFYKKGEKNPYYTINANSTYWWVNGSEIKDAVKVVFTPKATVAGMLNDATYTIYIRQEEQHAGDFLNLPYATLSITKVMPTTAKTLEFRPKQEVTEGSGKFIAYMIPNENAWVAPWATTFPTIDDADATKEAYQVLTSGDPKDNGFKNLNNIFYDLDKEGDIEFFFANSLKKNNKIVDLMDDDKNGIVYDTPGEHYVLDVATEFIDGKTEHAVTTYTNYDEVSTYIDADENVHFGETWSVKSNQSLTAIYACWHHAMHDVAFKTAVSLQWSAEGTEATTPFSNVTTKNSYNSTYFGLTLDKLLENKWLTLIEGSAELNTKADGTGQVNPYFKPTIDGTNINFTQESVQVDANPTANHDEYLILKFKDAFGHTVALASKVTIKKATSNAPSL